MDLLAPAATKDAHSLTARPALAARYRAVFWEPIPGTSERIVGLVAVEPHPSTQQAVAAATYPVITAPRLRQLLGSQRGPAARQVLEQCAGYMTERQAAGVPISELTALFAGFELGPVMVARAHTCEQLLDATVRSLSAFGSAEELTREDEARPAPRHMPRTREFLAQWRRLAQQQYPDAETRFDVPVRTLDQGDTAVTIDYAHGPVAAQVTSLPTTSRQAENAEQETMAKLYELDVARDVLNGQLFSPYLVINVAVLQQHWSDEAQRHALAARDRLQRLASFRKVPVLEVMSPAAADAELAMPMAA